MPITKVSSNDDSPVDLSRKRPADSEEQPSLTKQIKPNSPSTEMARETYSSSASAVKNTLHGLAFQVKLLVIFLNRALEQGYRFRLATEMDSAEKFDDLFFEKKNAQTQLSEYHFFQIKHRLDESIKISLSDLLVEKSRKNNPFSLQKYFIAFRQIKNNPQFTGTIKNLVILTNSQLDSVQLQEAKVILEPLVLDHFLNLNQENSGSASQCFRLRFSKGHELYKTLIESSNLYQLAKCLINAMEQPLSLANPLFKSYHRALIDEKIIDIATKKFHTDFINNEQLSLTAEKFRNIFFYEYSKKNKLPLANTDVIENRLKEIQLKISSGFSGSNKLKLLPDDEVTEGEITEFLNKFKFSVNNPNEEELSQLIVREFGKDTRFNLIDNDLLADHIQRKMLDWMKAKGPRGREGTFLSQQEGTLFFDELKQKIDKLILIAPTLEYAAKIKKNKLKFKKSALNLFNDFLMEDVQILHLINAGQTTVTATKLYQVISENSAYLKEDSYIFLRLSTALRIQDRLINAFLSSESYHLLIIDCKQSVGLLVELLPRLEAILQINSHKKLIFISQEDDVSAARLVLTLPFRAEADRLNFEQLETQSQEALLSRKINFQNHELLLKNLLDPEASATIDLTELFSRLDQSILKIGEKLPVPKSYIEALYVPRKLQPIEFDMFSFKNKYLRDRFFVTGINKKEMLTFVYDIQIVALEDFNRDTTLKRSFIFSKEPSSLDAFNELVTAIKKIDSTVNIHWLAYELQDESRGRFLWRKTEGSLANIRPLINLATAHQPYNEAFFVSKPLPEKIVILSDTPGTGKSYFLTHLADQFKQHNPNLWVSRINLKDCENHFSGLTNLDENNLVDSEKKIISFLQTILNLERKFEKSLFSYNFERQERHLLLFDGFDELSEANQENFINVVKVLRNTKLKQLWITTKPHRKKMLENKLSCFSFSFSPFSKLEQVEVLSRVWLETMQQPERIIQQKAVTYATDLIDSLMASNSMHSHTLTATPLTTNLLAHKFKASFLASIRKVTTPASLTGEITIFALYKHFISSTYESYCLDKANLCLENEAAKIIKKAAIETFNNQLEVFALHALFYPNLINEPNFPSNLLSSTAHLAQIGFLEMRGNKLHFIHASFTEYFVSRWLYKNYNNLHLKSLVVKILKLQVGLSSSLVQTFFDQQLVKDLPLHKEVLLQDLEGLIVCMEKNFEPGFVDRRDAIGRTPLHLAASLGNNDITLALLNRGANQKLSDSLLGWTPQRYATQGQHWYLANTLIEKNIRNSLSLEIIIDPSSNRKESLLHIAASNNLIFFAKAFLENSQRDEVNCVDSKGDTPLHRAAKLGNLEMLSFLLEHDAKFTYYNLNNLTPMDAAIIGGWLESVQSLKNHGALLQSGSYQKNEPFILAVSENRISIMQYLLKEGVDPFVSDYMGNTALHYASLNGGKEILNDLVPRYKQLNKIDERNLNEETALHYGAQEGRIDSIDVLLMHGANPTLKAMNGDTPVHYALLSKEGGNLDFISLFLRHPLVKGMDPVGSKGNTFLHYAASEGSLAVFKHLQSIWNDSLETKNTAGFTPFLSAIESGCPAMVEFFLNKDINLLVEDNFGESAAHHAARKGYVEILDLVLSKKPELLNKRNKNFQSPLDVAVEKNKNEIVEYLIAKAASFDGPGENTPLYMACEEGNIPLAKRFIEAGAEINRKAWNGNTPLMGAVIAQNHELVRYLIEQGADITLTNNRGQNVKAIAQIHKEHSLVDYFETKLKAGLEEGSSASLQTSFETLKELMREVDRRSLRSGKVNSALCGNTDSRRKREALECEEVLAENFWYDPVSEIVSESTIYRSHLFSLFNLAVLLEHSEKFPGSGVFTFENWLEYQQRFGELIQEGAENYSFRESELLHTHYQASVSFFDRYAKTTLLKLESANAQLGDGDATSHPSLLYDNGKELVLIFYRNQRYQLYSPDINYRDFIYSKTDSGVENLQRFVEKFFTWRRKEIPYRVFKLRNLRDLDLFSALQAAPFWQSNKMISDRALLNQASQQLEGIPEEIIQELFLVNSKMPHANALHPDFLLQNNGAITLRLEVLHHYLSDLNQEQREALFKAMQKYNWLAATLMLDSLDEHEKSLMLAYQEKVLLELKTACSITPERLSAISWEVLHKTFTHLLETDEPGLAEKLHDHLKTTHTTFSQLKDHLKVGTGQTLFFLPDLIKTANTGDPKGLLSNMGFLAADTTINMLYGRLVTKLASSLSAGRARLLRKLPVTSPIFKALTAYSIMELKQQLKTLPPNSERAQTIKHNLAEQYVTVGLITAEALGLEVTPLWILLIGEQLVFSAIHFRKDNQLDISFWDAFCMSLGFKQKELQHVFDERNLLQENFKSLESLNATAFAWIVIKIPELEQPRWIPVNVDAIPPHLLLFFSREAKRLSGYNTDKQVIEEAGFRLTNFYKLVRRAGRYTMGVSRTRVQPPEREVWEKKIYEAKISDTQFDFSPLENTYQEDNFFLQQISENTTYYLSASVLQEGTKLKLHSPVAIKGGLSALYSTNQMDRDKKQLYFNFDPREGSVSFNFTLEGLRALSNVTANANTTQLDTYSFTVTIKEKTYFEHLVFPSGQASRLRVTDSSQRLFLSYFVDTCVSSNISIEDNSRAVRLNIYTCFSDPLSGKATLISTMRNDPLQLIINHSEVVANQTVYPMDLAYHQIAFNERKDYLELSFKDSLIDRQLVLDADYLKISELQGKDAARFTILSSVKLLEMTIRGNLLIEDDESELQIEGFIDKSLAAIPYFRYVEQNGALGYYLNLNDLATLVDTLEFQNRGTLITFKYNGLHCAWRNKHSSLVTLYITGQLGANKGYLTVKKESCSLEIRNANNDLFHVENTYFSYSSNLVENSLLLGIFDRTRNTVGNAYRYTPATPGLNSSPPFFKAKQFYREEAPVFAMESKNKVNVFHRFLASRKIIFNKVAYCVRDGKVFGVPDFDSRLNGGQLLRYKQGDTKRPVAIYINSTLDNSRITNDWRDASLTINDAKLYNLANRTEINFSDSQRYSVKLLRETLHPFPHFSRESQTIFLNRIRRQVSPRAEFFKNPEIADKADSQFSNFSVDIPGNLLLFRVFNHWFKFIKPFSTPIVRQKKTKSTSVPVKANFFNLTQDFSNATSISNRHKDRMLL